MIYGAIFLVISAVVILKVGGWAIDWMADEETQDGSL